MKTLNEIIRQTVRLICATSDKKEDDKRRSYITQVASRYITNVGKYFGTSPENPMSSETAEIKLPRSIYAGF